MNPMHSASDREIGSAARGLASRRALLQGAGMGMGLMSLGRLLGQDPRNPADGVSSNDTASGNPASGNPATSGTHSMGNSLRARPPHFAPRAKRMIHFFLNGGPSHVDTFDPKPMLKEYAGKPLPTSLLTERRTGGALPSPFRFDRYGQSGLEISELFAKTAAHADEIAVIRSMYAQVPNHEPSLMLMNCGDSVQSRPSLGAWLMYGLGSVNENLPGFIAMCPGGYPIKDTANWESGFLPGSFQGTFVDPNNSEFEKLIENIRSPFANLES